MDDHPPDAFFIGRDPQTGLVDVTYNFVYSQTVGEDPCPYEEGSQIRIRSFHAKPNGDGNYECTAFFSWKQSYIASFTCLSDGDVKRFGYFEDLRCPGRSPMVDIERVVITHIIKTGDNDRREVYDDYGSPFLHFWLSWGIGEGKKQHAIIFGKRVRDGFRDVGTSDQLTLSKGERERLSIPEGH